MKILSCCNINVNPDKSVAIPLLQSGFKDDIHQARAKKAHDQQKILEDHVGGPQRCPSYFVFFTVMLTEFLHMILPHPTIFFDDILQFRYPPGN